MLRQFSTIEQRIIRKLVKEIYSENPIFLANVVDGLFVDLYVSVNKDKEIVQIWFKPGMTETAIMAQTRLAELVLLMTYLESSGYVYLFNCTNLQNSSYRIGQGTPSECLCKYSFPDNNLSEWLLNNVDKQIYVTNDLVELVDNNFVSKEDIKFREQQNQTWFAIIVSFVLGIGAMVVEIYCAFLPKFLYLVLNFIIWMR